RAARGIIYSADNTVLAESKPTYIILHHSFDKYLKPSDQIVKELSKILGRKIAPIDESRRYGKVVKLKDNLSIEDMFKIQEKKISLKDISVVKEPRRIYYYPQATSHIVGYIGKIGADEIEDLSERGYKMEDYIGRGGIEQAYDEYLHGKNGGWQIEVNAKGYRVKAFEYIAPEVGASIYSTIDLKLQQIAYETLKNSATGMGAVVVLDAKTGAVKALVSCPGFDANTAGSREFGKYLEDKTLPLFNRALQALYPPGSVFKIITFAAAMDIKKIDPSETLHCAGTFELGKRHYICWYRSGHSKLNLISAMAQSCNIYFYQLGLKLGIRNLEKYAKKFYLDHKTGIDLPNEKKGFIPNPEWKNSKLKMPWFQGDTIIFAIGQGALCVTPLQMACMISVVANNGVYRKPYIVEKVVDFNGNEVYKCRLEFDNKLELSDETWKLLHQALTETVENGTGRKCKIPGIKIAGKTGTAQNPQGKDHAWFVSYAPVDDPEIAIAVIVEHGGGGGLNAVPICRKIYEAYFSKEENKGIKQ
ncbi:MAG: penicillin-binding protein 2, partial [Endomicrobium sp.]|nr:penicillin-binding protein 2 [Endomicrobium sp.]